MKLSAIALDYDGTIAENGIMHADVRTVVGELRRRGIAVVLVTGRRLCDLRAVAGDRDCLDAASANIDADDAAHEYCPSLTNQPPSTARFTRSMGSWARAPAAILTQTMPPSTTTWSAVGPPVSRCST